MNKFHEIEIQKLYDVLLTTENLRIQLGIFFATISLGALGIAITQEKSIIFFFSAIFLLIMVPVDLKARRTLASTYYRVAYLHKKYVKNDNDYSPKISKLAQEALRILDLPKNQDKTAELRSISVRVISPLGFWLPISVSLVEIIIGILLWQLMGWSLI